ncbi:MAG: TIGR03619 family F420-dependent LLM class oxidoreductase [Acidimicrobiia bacterium]|nr:TIGR03619 family F420-dependent LLM class oxidoreductase [Acidimicrobiia bacterium]
MNFGVSVFPTVAIIRPDDLAKDVEDRGFASLWFPEHSHIPTSRATPWGGREGAPPLPKYYAETFDQFVALTAAAASTTTLRLGAGISLVAQRDPIWLAKQVASIDVLSGGRFEFGIGYGWNKEEMAQHGVQYGDRRALLREKVLMMKELWTAEVAVFKGELLELEPTWAWPKPLQRPHPPISLGSAGGPRTFADIIEFCDTWMPIPSRTDLATKVAELRKQSEASGRDPDSIGLGVFGARPKDEFIDLLRELGFETVIFSLRQDEPEAVNTSLDEYTAFIQRHRD